MAIALRLTELGDLLEDLDRQPQLLARGRSRLRRPLQRTREDPLHPIADAVRPATNAPRRPVGRHPRDAPHMPRYHAAECMPGPPRLPQLHEQAEATSPDAKALGRSAPSPGA